MEVTKFKLNPYSDTRKKAKNTANLGKYDKYTYKISSRDKPNNFTSPKLDDLLKNNQNKNVKQKEKSQNNLSMIPEKRSRSVSPNEGAWSNHEKFHLNLILEKNKFRKL